MADSAPPSIVVIGSGLAGFGVLREMRRLSPQAKLTMITAEEGHFYSKPALSTALAKGKTAETLVTTPIEKIAAQLRLDARTGREAEAIDRVAKAVLTTGGPVPYDKLILATGAAPFRPELGGDAAHRTISVNRLTDYERFRRELPDGATVLVMGAGLVGTEFANDLISSGYRPIVVDMLPLPLAQLTPPEVGMMVRDALAAQGVAWHLGRRIETIEYRVPAPGYVATLDDGSRIEVDIVLSAVGLRPDVSLADEAGLAIDRGIVVDEHGRTSDPDIFAIGDCAQYPHGLSAYVTPIMAAARAIAASALGTTTAMRFPPLSVQVKTTLLPINLLPPAGGTAGEWRMVEQDEAGSKHGFFDAAGTLRGYVLTGDRCEERMDMDARVGVAA